MMQNETLNIFGVTKFFAICRGFFFPKKSVFRRSKKKESFSFKKMSNPILVDDLSQNGGLKTLKVEFSSQCSRIPYPNDENDKNIEDLWTEKRSKNPNVRLFNAMKFRLANSIADPTSSTLTLQLGLSDYKSHVGTNARPRSTLQQQEEDDDDQVSREKCIEILKNENPFLAHALGVEACVFTCDDHIVLFRRSKHVSDFAGFYACPGGHAEPWRVLEKLFSNSTSKTNEDEKEERNEAKFVCPLAMFLHEKLDEKIPAKELRESYNKIICGINEEHSSVVDKLIVEELYHSICEEVSSELGVPFELVQVESILGLVRAIGPTQRGKPDLLFQVRLKNITFQELKKAYFPNRQGDDAFEADDDSLLGIPVGEKLKPGSVGMNKTELKEWIFSSYQLSPPGAAAVQLGIDAF